MAFVGLGVTGGIGAYKAVEVARLLQKRGHRVQAVMTRTARRFVGPLTFEAITREPVITSQFAPGMNADIEHIALASDMNLLLVAPATANIIGKFANGIADDFLSALYLATRAPVLLAPAMNTNMWDHPATRRTSARCAARGVRFVDPGEGYLACGWVGKGRLAEPEDIVEAVERIAERARSLSRASACSSPRARRSRTSIPCGSSATDRAAGWDSHRARSRARAAPRSCSIAGPTALEPPPVSEVVRVRSAARDARRRHGARGDRADVVIMAAAVADYTPAGGAATREDREGRPAHPHAGADARHPRGAWRAPRRPRLAGARRVCRADGRPRARRAPEARRRSAWT